MLRLLALLLLAISLISQPVNAQGINVYNLDQTLSTTEAQVPTLQSSVTSSLSSMTSTANAASYSMAGAIGPIATSLISPVYKRAADLDILVADIQRTATIDAPAFISTIQASISTRVVQQTTYRQSVASNLQALIAGDSTAAMSTLAAASTIRAQFKSDASTNRVNTLNAANSNMTIAFNNENSRAVTEAATQSTQVSSTTVQLSTSLSTSMAAEASRADAACLARAQLGTGVLPQQAGSNDYATW